MTAGTPRAGAALIVRRRDGSVLTGIRTALARSWPGTVAFPGGAVDDDDHEIPLFSQTRGPEGIRRAGALREALEEAGVVRLCNAAGGAIDVDSIDGIVAALRSGRPLKLALRDARAVLDDRSLVGLGSWVTAEGTFEVTRFLLSTDDVTLVPPLVEELTDTAFRSPRALVSGWKSGSVFLLPPIRLVLHRLANHEGDDDDDGLIRSLSLPPTEPERKRRDLIEGVVVVDTRTPTLAPATHTNCVVLGTGDVLLVDPATPYEDERERFDGVLQTILEGRRVRGVFLTHHHHDHVGDAARLARKHRVPVYCHEETARRVHLGADVDVVTVGDGDEFELGARVFRCVFTPGHAPGHLCLFDVDARMLIAGDMIAAIGSILIDPPEGHMATYLRSLDRLVALAPRALIPAHGPLLVDATKRLADQKQHRLKREASVRAAIEAGATDVDAVVSAVYGDTPPEMLVFAARSVAAIVEKLQEDKAVVDVEGRWRPAA
ncbi:MAG: MBL fold metallo-hydrolase [Deltaproteobacteria bacterium]|nr:MBL fold metallo-hydrolase [Deltaproteobacteria bacterium]